MSVAEHTDRITAQLWDCTAEQYHGATSRVSNSTLNVWRQSRQRYYRRFVAQLDPPPEPTPQMILGTLLHGAVLEPEAYADRTAVAPHVDRRTKAGKEDWGKFCADSEGKTIVTVEHADAVKAMREALMRNAVSRALIERDGRREQSIIWTDQQSGLPLKARLDAVLPDLILDLKTARDVTPRGFATSVASLGYHRQAEWYTRGWSELTGEVMPFVFVAVCTEAPHEVAVYELEEGAVRLGAEQNRSALQQLAACHRNDDWLSPFEKKINTLSLPKWAVYDDEYTIYE